jgi:hypothetical protein
LIVPGRNRKGAARHQTDADNHFDIHPRFPRQPYEEPWIELLSHLVARAILSTSAGSYFSAQQTKQE